VLGLDLSTAGLDCDLYPTDRLAAAWIAREIWFPLGTQYLCGGSLVGNHRLGIALEYAFGLGPEGTTGRFGGIHIPGQ